MRKRFLKITLRTKRITLSERALKTVAENSVGSCVHFCLRSLGPLERCVPSLLLPPEMVQAALEGRGRGQNSICGTTTTHFNLGKALRWEELKLIIQQHAQAFRQIRETP